MIKNESPAMKYALLLPILLLPALPAHADGHFAKLFTDHNPSEIVSRLAQDESDTASDHFALGAAHFLSAIENAYQLRYQYDFGNFAAENGVDAPFLTLPVQENPNPAAFNPAILDALFETALQDLARSTQALSQIGDDDDVSVTVDLTTLWLDINANGTKDAGEEFYGVLSAGLGFESASLDNTPILTNFDTADAAWLSAYGHMLSGMSELALSVRPSDAVSEALSNVAHIDGIRGQQPLRPLWGMSDFARSPEMDILVASTLAVFGDPSPTHTRSAHSHFLQGIEDNKAFWRRLEAEKDNSNEFIPNDQQTSAMPIVFPQGIGNSWQSVLADAEAVLKGDLLLPHWRVGNEGGINLAKILQNPEDLDIVRLFLGHSSKAYIEAGPVIDFATLDAFDEMTQGNSPMFALILN